MKNITKQLFIILLFAMLTSLHADVSIDQQIQNIKNAPPAKRVEMMNALKVQLSNMNSQDRSASIAKMRSQMHSKPSQQNNNNNMNQRMQKNHSDSMQQMNGMQRTNQHQVGEQYMQDNIPNGPNTWMHP